jgi:hypothetical protein
MQKKLNNWRLEAVCLHDKNSGYWLSCKYSEVLYAKEGCSRCTVRTQCFLAAIQDEEFIGVSAGISEYDFLMSTWKKATKKNGTNRDRSDKTIKALLQKIS